jgi:hypothetical protein
MDQQSQYNQVPNTTPVTPVTPVMGSQKDDMGNGHKKVGPIIATLVIVLILIVAALYLFASRINQQAIPDDTTSSANSVPAPIQSVAPVTGNSTDPASLQSDLDASTQGLDSQNF